ncbi:MAG: dihydrolipoamide acetyltransferase family protein [Pseudomonadota bacterium]
MGQFTIKLPDVGEGVAEAELVEWMVDEGQNVREDDVLAAVMTDKATVEIPSPVDGKIIWRGGKIGDVIPVGSALIRLDVEGEGNGDSDDDLATNDVKAGEAAKEEARPVNGAANPLNGTAVSGVNSASAKAQTSDQPDRPSVPRARVAAIQPTASAIAGAQISAPRPEGQKPLAAPAVRQRAREGGLDLRRVAGSGPAGRITHGDLDAVFANVGAANGGGRGQDVRQRPRSPRNGVEEIPMVGLRRKIADKMSISKSRIPHITYVDEIDLTALEDLRTRLNANRRDDQPKLTLLPFLMKAMEKAVADTPQVNSLYDDEAGIIRQHDALHMGVAAQTPNGLMVPVVRHVEARSLWDCAAEVARLADAAKTGTASREELSGSTITITSLGAMGGIVTTPVINHPEVAIVGVNKMQTKPVWDGTQFVPRKIMNLSSSFDHRVIDGWDCAVFIQRIKGLLESPAEIFIDE